jgi:hypothetical protein
MMSSGGSAMTCRHCGERILTDQELLVGHAHVFHSACWRRWIQVAETRVPGTPDACDLCGRSDHPDDLVTAPGTGPSGPRRRYHVACLEWSEERRGRAQPTCRVCAHPIAPSDHVVFDPAELVHAACRETVRDVAGELAALLTRHRGRCFCHSCLARRLGASFAELRKASVALRGAGVLRAIPAVCADCGQARVTITAQTARPDVPTMS